jgi:hypothetical protein
LAALRNQQFLSLPELNTAIREKLAEFLDKPFQKKEGSRSSLFAEEKPFLLPLPDRPYELAVWKPATVQYNYHVQVADQNYSVPFEYIKRKVEARITRNVIEIFFEGHRICSHPRLGGRLGQYSTAEIHMPPEHRQYVTWNGERFKSWAVKVGPHTTKVIQYFLNLHKVEQQGYKSCLTLLRLADKHSTVRLEAACTRALSLTAIPSCTGIAAILRSGQDRLPDEVPSAASTGQEYGFTRGPDYYRRGDEPC